jgi:hypothetical protein
VKLWLKSDILLLKQLRYVVPITFKTKVIEFVCPIWEIVVSNMTAWKVLENGVWIDTVHYLNDCDADYVLRCEANYGDNVTVERLK